MINKISSLNFTSRNYGVKNNSQKAVQNLAFRGQDDRQTNNATKPCEADCADRCCPYEWNAQMLSLSVEDKNIKAARANAQKMYKDYVSANKRYEDVKAEHKGAVDVLEIASRVRKNEERFLMRKVETTDLGEGLKAVKVYAKDGSLSTEFLTDNKDVKEFTIYREDGEYSKYVADEAASERYVVYKKTSSDKPGFVSTVDVGYCSYEETFVNEDGKKQTNRFRTDNDEGTTSYYEDITFDRGYHGPSDGIGAYALGIYEYDGGKVNISKGYEYQYRLGNHYDEILYMDKHSSCNQITEYRKNYNYDGYTSNIESRILFDEDGRATRYDEKCKLENGRFAESEKTYASKDGYRWTLKR